MHKDLAYVIVWFDLIYKNSSFFDDHFFFMSFLAYFKCLSYLSADQQYMSGRIGLNSILSTSPVYHLENLANDN